MDDLAQLLRPAEADAQAAGANDDAALGPGQFWHMAIYVALILFFAFFYTAVVFNPVETADNLRKYNGFLPGIRPVEER